MDGRLQVEAASFGVVPLKSFSVGETPASLRIHAAWLNAFNPSAVPAAARAAFTTCGAVSPPASPPPRSPPPRPPRPDR